MAGDRKVRRDSGGGTNHRGVDHSGDQCCLLPRDVVANFSEAERFAKHGDDLTVHPKGIVILARAGSSSLRL